MLIHPNKVFATFQLLTQAAKQSMLLHQLQQTALPKPIRKRKLHHNRVTNQVVERVNNSQATKKVSNRLSSRRT